MRVVTIRDVARNAGVSISTVSRVLNNRPDVDGATREKVMAVVEKMQYVRNANAANLKQRHTASAAVILRGRRNGFLTDLAERILDIGRRSGIRFLIEIIDEKADEFEVVRALCRERKLFGVIFLGSNLAGHEEEIAQLDLPCVFATVEAAFLSFDHVSSVSIDNFSAGRVVMDELIKKGHRRVALLGYFGGQNNSTGRRLFGARESLAAHGIPYDNGLYEECDFTLASGYEGMCRVLERCPDLTAVFAISDLIAIGAMKALHDRGLNVPEDVSVIGFDGTEQAAYTIPALTTVAQPAQEIAEEAVKSLMASSTGEKGRHVLLPVKMVEGASLAPRG